MTEIKPLSIAKRVKWRKWLENNHNQEKEIWLIFYKKHSGKQKISLEEAVEEALCFGWIDCILKRIDDEKHIIRFTPRKKNSIWSKINRKRAEKMINDGKMTDEGFAKIEEAKSSGKWSSAYTLLVKPTMPSDLKRALKEKQKAWQNFNEFANSYQANYIYWVNSAKREETRKRRIEEVVARAIQNKKPGVG